MNERQQNLFKLIVSEFTKSALPVGSKFIASSGKFKLSPATIRNEMVELENQGLISHPHTSAGRIPTQKGYEYFVENFITDIELNQKQKDFLDKTVKSFKDFKPQACKEIAKGVSEFTNGAVFVAFSDNDFYYTGLSNLFSQPEFEQHQLVYSLSRVIDHLDNVIKKIFNNINHDVEIYIGSNNPFSADCSSLVTKFGNKDNQGILGIIGPTRMDYQNNVSLLKYSQQLINNLK